MVEQTCRLYNPGVRVIVIGGRGHLGSRAVRALGRAPELQVECASRTAGGLRIDLRDPSSFEALRGSALVVNASSSHAASPERLAEFCLRAGLCLLETSSDRRVMQRLLALRAAIEPPTGSLVLGAGIFTGLSNLLGAAAVSGNADCQRLELAVRSSPFSGAGPGTIDLMLDGLRTPACMIAAGQLVEHGPIERGPDWPHAGARLPSLLISLAEAPMLHASQRVPNVGMYMLPKPSWLAGSFLATPAWLLASRWYRALLWLQFTLLRRLLLRARPTVVELFARARAAAGGGRTCSLVCRDGMWTAGVAIAAMASCLTRAPTPPGVYCIDERLTLHDVLSVMRQLDPSCVTLHESELPAPELSAGAEC
jgi:hypothetical protein